MTGDEGDEAPYGRHPDGTPKRSNGGRPKGTGTRATRRKRTTSTGGQADAPKRKATPNAAPKPRADSVDYTETFSMLVGMAGALIAPALPLDGYVLMTSADGLGEAGNELAQINPYVRKMADRLMTVGPYGGIVAKLSQVGAQLAENHGWLPPQVTSKLGAVPRAQLIARIQSEQAHEAAQYRAAQQSADAMNFGQADAAPYAPESADAPFTRSDYGIPV